MKSRAILETAEWTLRAESTDEKPRVFFVECRDCEDTSAPENDDRSPVEI